MQNGAKKGRKFQKKASLKKGKFESFSLLIFSMDIVADVLGVISSLDLIISLVHCPLSDIATAVMKGHLFIRTIIIVHSYAAPEKTTVFAFYRISFMRETTRRCALLSCKKN